MYDNLPFEPKMVRVGPKLQAAYRESLKVLGSTNLIFTVNGLTIRQTFCVTDGLNRSFVDFSKAFDSVWRDALFYKMNNLRISGNIFQVIKKYVL